MVLSFGNAIAPKLMSLKVSLVWCSDSSEENSRRREDPSCIEAETAGFLAIRVEAVVRRSVWLDRLLSEPVVLGAKRRLARFVPKK